MALSLSVRDSDVRAVLHLALNAQHAGEIGRTRIWDEFDLAGNARADVAVLNGSFAGYEIKSERDSLKRFERQVPAYSEFFDSATVVAAPKHLAAVEQVVPSWWSVVSVDGVVGELTLTVARVGTVNTAVDPFKLCWLLWRNELVDELAARDLLYRVRSKPRSAMIERLASSVALDEIRRLVRDRLKARQGWRAVPSPAADDASCHVDATSPR